MVTRTGTIVVALIAVVGLLLAAGWVLQRRLIYLPATGPAAGPPAGVSEVVLRTEDGLDLAAWWLDPTGPDRGRAVLVLPGNAGNRSLRVPLGRDLARAGFAVLLVDYRGYGGNPGRPSEQGLAADARAAHRHLVDRYGAERSGVAPIVFGESLGAAVATRLATEVPVAALVLRSPFTSLADVAAEHYPLPVSAARMLLRDRFPVAKLVVRVSAPVTVVLGEHDEVVPPEQSRAVAAAAGATLVEVAGAGHNDAVLGSGPRVVDAVVRAGD